MVGRQDTALVSALAAERARRSIGGEKGEIMSTAISWDLMLKVNDGQLESFRSLMDEMVASTRDEPGAVIYEWFVSDDGGSVHIYERYADSDATLAHLGGFAEKFAQRFFSMVEPTSFHAYGAPSAACREALEGAGAQFLSPFGGFAR
jgi:quinol monooxygenase YgiN